MFTRYGIAYVKDRTRSIPVLQADSLYLGSRYGLESIQVLSNFNVSRETL